jgi:glycosyltransferase involved in cell wall biosynthesis
MAQKIKEIKPDIIHISTPGFIGLIGLFIAKKNGIKILGTYHTDFPMYLYKNINLRLLKWLVTLSLKLFYKGFSALLTRSGEYIEHIHKDIGFDKKDIHHLVPGTNISTFDPKYKNEELFSSYNLSTNSLKFLYVGRLSKEKNVDILFDIWKEFYTKSSIKDAQLIMVGSGELDRLQNELRPYNIVFLGHKQKEELSSLYASSSFFIFPSTTDTLGQVVLESLASATPVIVTNIGGPCGIVSKSKKDIGFILDIEKKDAWVKLLLEIESEKIDIKTMGENSYEYSKNFSIEKTFDSFYDTHLKYVDKKKQE